MTTDNDDENGSAVKPQVIDLEAEDVTSQEAKPAAPEPEKKPASAAAGNGAPRGDRKPERPTPPSPPRRNTRRGLFWLALAALVGLVAGGWLYRDVLSGYLPTSEMTALRAEVEALDVTTRNQAEQISAAGKAADEASRKAEDLGTAVADAQAAASDARKALAPLDQRLAAAEAGLKKANTEIANLRSAIASGAGTSSPADAAALAAIGQRLDELEKDVASLKAGSGTGGDATLVSALRQDLSDLQAKVAAGLPYKDELDRITRAVPSIGGNDTLNAYADQGLPNAAGLASELRVALPTLPQPTAAEPAAQQGYLSSMWNALTSIVTIRDVGEEDWQAVAGQAATVAETGDLAAAIAVIDKARGARPAVISRWRERATGRERLELAVAEAAKAVALVIAARGGGQ